MQAGGAHQLPFMAAASRATRGELGPCPKCQQGALRCYFHVFQKEKRQGTLWLWCGSCSTFTHLPRVQVNAPTPPDPFEQLSLKAFAELETSATEPFFDRLDRMWDEGQLFLPGAGENR